jgi:hypothetical protein
MKNGKMVHVLLGENGLVATFRGERDDPSSEGLR